MEDVEKGIEFCKKDGILSGEDFKDCGTVKLSEESVMEYLEFLESSL